MKKLFFAFILSTLSFFLFTSCSRVDVPREPVKGQLQKLTLQNLDSIPAEFGSLISVTANQEYPRWAQLWFQASDGTIRIVSVGFFDQILRENVTVIPRKELAMTT